MNNKMYSVGIVGTGFIAKGLMHALDHDSQLSISKVLTRRPFESITNLPIKKSQLTHKINQLIKESDIVIEATGDVLYGTEVVEHVLLAGIPVVTMNAELQLTTGSMLSKLGTLVEAEGDQPGTLAALNREITQMGFKPVVFGNIKGFLHHTPQLKDMEYWGEKQGIRLDKVTAFTDGTKVEIEQALVANGLGATITEKGMLALENTNYQQAAEKLGEIALEKDLVLSDYVVSANAPAGVFIVATHDNAQSSYLEYLKLGKGPLYTITRPYHLCHLEIPKTIRAVLSGNQNYQFNNSQNPKIQVYPLAKTNLKAGEKILNGIGNFKIRGRAKLISENLTAVPIGLMSGAILERDISEGKMLTFDDISIPDSRALDLWKAHVFEHYHAEKIVKRQQRYGRKTISGQPNTKGLWYQFLRHTKNNFKVNQGSNQ